MRRSSHSDPKGYGCRRSRKKCSATLSWRRAVVRAGWWRLVVDVPKGKEYIFLNTVGRAALAVSIEGKRTSSVSKRSLSTRRSSRRSTMSIYTFDWPGVSAIRVISAGGYEVVGDMGVTRRCSLRSANIKGIRHSNADIRFPEIFVQLRGYRDCWK